jgi:hypothetical protein
MSGITLAMAESQLALWLAADQAVAAGQSYSIKDRSLSRADAGEITNKIDYWNNWVQHLSRRASGASRTRYAVTE